MTVAGTIDRETDRAVRNITVRATSQDGSTADQTFAINIIDVGEFDVTTPIDANATANSVAENAAIGMTVGITASSTDSDATTNGVSYSLVNNDGGRFAIDANTGVVTVADAINRETMVRCETLPSERHRRMDRSLTRRLRSILSMWMSSM